MIPVLPALTKALSVRSGGALAWVFACPRRTPATWAGAGCAEGPPRFALLPRAAAPFFSERGIRRADTLRVGPKLPSGKAGRRCSRAAHVKVASRTGFA